MPVIKYKNRCIKFKNKAADVRNRFELTLEQTNGGLLSSNKLSGWWNDEITLYNTPSAHYDFNGYSITGSTLYDNNKFKFNGASVSAEAIFTPWPVRNVSLVQTSGGTITATPMTGYDGDTVVLTNTPEYGYDFISYELTGSTLYDDNKFDFNGNNVSVKSNFKINYNPLNLPPMTVRVKLAAGSPAPSSPGYRVSAVQGQYDVYDVCTEGLWGGHWNNLITHIPNTVELLGANTTNVTSMGSMFLGCDLLKSIALFDITNLTSMGGMFAGCTSLTSVPLFDTHNVVDMNSMFQNCHSLTSVPLFDTSNTTNMNYMFLGCSSLKYIPLFDTNKVRNMDYMFSTCMNVQSGALSFYHQASTQAIPPSSHNKTFFRCGIDSPAGSAEVDQIPADWK